MSSNRLRSLADAAPRYLFLFSVGLLILLYGVFAGHYKLFPQPQLRHAKSAANALLSAVREESAAHDTVSQTESVVQNHAGMDDGALILVSGGPGYFASYNPDGGCMAWLMNRKGEIQHIWKFNPELWADLEHVNTVPGLSYVYPMDMHLLADGGLLVSFQCEHAWPYGVGMARFDKDSNTIWKKECNAHHWFIVTPDEKIITPTMRVGKTPQPIGLTRGRINSEDGLVLEDFITVMSLDGEILEETSMLQAVNDSGLIGLYQGAARQTTGVTTTDPLHLNFVQLVGEDVAADHDWLKADDLLLSFRSINTIAILDRATSRIKWHSAGTTLRQHSPVFVDSDNILIFDNHGGNESLGGTRLAQMGLEHRIAETIFPTEENKSWGKVYSATEGHLDLNRERDAVLMAISNDSKVLEISLDSRTVLWEYRFADTVPTIIHTAKYCYDVSFEMNQKERSK
jgi:hypothetical protein